MDLRQLEDFGLYQQRGDQHQYKTAPDGRWFTATNFEDAVAMAQEAARNHKAHLFTTRERYDLAVAKELEESHTRWGHMSNDEIGKMIDRDTLEARALYRHREIVDGRRRSRVAMGNQGARESFEMTSKARRYLQHRETTETHAP